jgi:hypothetical protein
MKRSWQPEELIEHWTLIPTELDLLTKKTDTNRLGIALLLKYFQYEGRFPTSKAEISREVVRYVAQLGVKVAKIPLANSLKRWFSETLVEGFSRWHQEFSVLRNISPTVSCYH